ATSGPGMAGGSGGATVGSGVAVGVGVGVGVAVGVAVAVGVYVGVYVGVGDGGNVAVGAANTFHDDDAPYDRSETAAATAPTANSSSAAPSCTMMRRFMR